MLRLSEDDLSKGEPDARQSTDRTPEPIMPPRVSLLVPLLILLGVLLVSAGNAGAAVTPTCDGLPATIFKADGSPGRLAGTSGDDVIVGSIGRDNIEAGGGDDLICTVDGRDSILGRQRHRPDLRRLRATTRSSPAPAPVTTSTAARAVTWSRSTRSTRPRTARAATTT